MNSKSIAITIIVALAVGGAGFYGGTIYEKSSLSKQGLLRNANSANRQPGQGGPGGQNGAGGQGRSFARGGNGGNGGFASGQITAVNNNSLTVKMQDGSSKIVLFSDSTSFGKSVSGSASDLSSGENVIISGTNNSDGSITAQNIQIRPSQPQGQN